jgi:hypothetical protein
MITNINDAMAMFDMAENDIRMDMGEEFGDPEWADIVSYVARDCDDATALELCRIKLGFVPYDLRMQLGSHDWLDS